ncbi:hypothetical protein GCM10009570_19140 [Dietzia natronolimnaea]
MKAGAETATVWTSPRTVGASGAATTTPPTRATAAAAATGATRRPRTIRRGRARRARIGWFLPEGFGSLTPRIWERRPFLESL